MGEIFRFVNEDTVFTLPWEVAIQEGLFERAGHQVEVPEKNPGNTAVGLFDHATLAEQAAYLDTLAVAQAPGRADEARRPELERLADDAIVNFGGMLHLHRIANHDFQSCLGKPQAAARMGDLHRHTERLLHGLMLLFDAFTITGIHLFHGAHHAFFG